MNDYRPVLDYIDAYWDKMLIRPWHSEITNPRNLILHLGLIKLPNPGLAPNHRYFAACQYYWDSYFTILGLVVSGRGELARGIVDNFCYLYDKFGLVPARNAWTSLGRTQPPFLTRMAWEVYEAGAADDAWLDKVMSYAWREYEEVWTKGQRLDPVTGLSQYQPRFLRRLLTVYESGWDVSSRFAHGRTSVIPVDLNCMLYQYESDFIAWCEHRKDSQGVKLWRNRQQARRAAIDKYLWSQELGFYYDYDLKAGQRDELGTLAGYFALWSGVASPEQAAACQQKLVSFEHPYGLANTEALPWHHRQWDYPNGWPPHQFIVYEGMRRYGFGTDARRITEKYLNLNFTLFEQTGELWEKYDVVNGQIGLRGRYPTQPGFGWTNSVFLRLLRDMEA
jgi:alpha,alpha-trehalase